MGGCKSETAAEAVQIDTLVKEVIQGQSWILYSVVQASSADAPIRSLTALGLSFLFESLQERQVEHVGRV